MRQWKFLDEWRRTRLFRLERLREAKAETLRLLGRRFGAHCCASRTARRALFSASTGFGFWGRLPNSACTHALCAVASAISSAVMLRSPMRSLFSRVAGSFKGALQLRHRSRPQTSWRGALRARPMTIGPTFLSPDLVSLRCCWICAGFDRLQAPGNCMFNSMRPVVKSTLSRQYLKTSRPSSTS